MGAFAADSRHFVHHPIFDGGDSWRGETATQTDFPLVIFNVASLQRLRDHAGLMFESAERIDMTDRVDQWTAETLKETKGFDRKRPFGIMMYLNTDSFMRPMGISYLPVENLEETLQTLAYGNGTIVPVEGEPNRHDIRYSESFTLRTLYQNQYLFMVGPDGSDAALELNFPDPAKVTAKLSERYDIAASCLIKTIPPGMKLLALEAFKNQAIANLSGTMNQSPYTDFAVPTEKGGWRSWIRSSTRERN